MQRLSKFKGPNVSFSFKTLFPYLFQPLIPIHAFFLFFISHTRHLHHLPPIPPPCAGSHLLLLFSGTPAPQDNHHHQHFPVGSSQPTTILAATDFHHRDPPCKLRPAHLIVLAGLIIPAAATQGATTVSCQPVVLLHLRRTQDSPTISGGHPTNPPPLTFITTTIPTAHERPSLVCSMQSTPDHPPHCFPTSPHLVVMVPPTNNNNKQPPLPTISRRLPLSLSLEQ
jgi:hypothetical protein